MALLPLGEGSDEGWRGARNLAVLLVLSRVLRAVRLAFHPARSLVHGFLSWVLLCCLLSANGAFARAAPPPSPELLEFLGELEDEELDDMEIVLAAVEIKANKIKPPTRPKEVKDEGRN